MGVIRLCTNCVKRKSSLVLQQTFGTMKQSVGKCESTANHVKKKKKKKKKSPFLWNPFLKKQKKKQKKQKTHTLDLRRARGFLCRWKVYIFANRQSNCVVHMDIALVDLHPISIHFNHPIPAQWVWLFSAFMSIERHLCLMRQWMKTTKNKNVGLQNHWYTGATTTHHKVSF